MPDEMSSAAPWKPLLAHHLSLLKPPAFTLATISHDPSPTNPLYPTQNPPLSTSTVAFPRLRTIIHRGFLGTIPENQHNPLFTHNPPKAYYSDLPTFTTDSRTTKTGELGNGQPVEACYWIPGDTTTGEEVQNQWRVRGVCYLLHEEPDKEITDKLQLRLIPGEDGDKASEWTWTKEVHRHWGNMMPAMRGSFANPPPGVPLEDFASGKDGLEKGRKVKNEELLKGKDGSVERIARRNFRVGVIVPDMVERVDLSADEKKGRRWVWWRVEEEEEEGGKAKWVEREIWP